MNTEKPGSRIAEQPPKEEAEVVDERTLRSLADLLWLDPERASELDATTLTRIRDLGESALKVRGRQKGFLLGDRTGWEDGPGADYCANSRRAREGC